MITRRDFVRTNEGDRTGDRKGGGGIGAAIMRERYADKRSINLIFEIYIVYYPVTLSFFFAFEEFRV